MGYRKSLKAKVKLAEPLKKHTSLRIGGPAKYFFEPASLLGLKSALTFARKEKVPILILGAGSNILAKDKGVDCSVIKIGQAAFAGARPGKKRIEAGAGLKISGLLNLAARRGFSGAEFLAGIPGTIGGALAMNASCRGRSIADIVEKVRVMDYNGRIKDIRKSKCGFGYRSSGIAKYIILGALLKFHSGDKRAIRRKISGYLRQRKQTQDLSFPSAGCVFKNPKGKMPAGFLIDRCGLKGKGIGNARISDKHANFIINLGLAKAGDVLKLMALAKKEVKRKFNIVLEPEIKIWE